MPLYDFHCGSCGKDFEELVRDAKDARCPACGDAKVTKELSAFAVGGSKSAEASMGPCNVSMCGTSACKRGPCGMN